MVTMQGSIEAVPDIARPGSQRRTCRVGFAQTDAHHGEIVQGVFYSNEGALEHGLVTLPCSLYRARAQFRPVHSGPLAVAPANCLRARTAARLTLDALGRTGWGGWLQIESNVPVRWGCGSSTTDVLASIKAVADAFNAVLEPEWIARISVAAETASDSLMYGPERTVLFAQRRGSLLMDLGGPLPPMQVLGFNTEIDRGVETLSLQPMQYSSWEIEAFRAMLGLLRRAIEQQDPFLVGRVATASTLITQRHRPKRFMSQLLRLSNEIGALGIQVAHSGTVAGFLFDCGSETEERLERARTGLKLLGLHDSCWEFATSRTGYREIVA